MSFWQEPTDPLLGHLTLTSSSDFEEPFLLGSTQSNLLILGFDGKKEIEMKRKPIKTQTDGTSASSDNQVHISSFQPNHFRVVSGKSSPKSSIIKHGNNIDPIITKDEMPIISKEDIKLERLESILNSSNVDLALLKKLTWSGIPTQYRAISWQLLLNYAPTSMDRRLETLTRKRLEYKSYKDQFFLIGDESKLDKELWHQIKIDAIRTNQDLKLFRLDKVQRILERILYCWSIRHPASSYVQGINDLATPFIVIFINQYAQSNTSDEYDINPDSIDEYKWLEIEADTFWCLTKLLDGIQDNFTSAQRGIQRQLNHLKYLITRIDSQLATHIDSQNLLYVQFAFRWMNCLLMREFKLNHVIRLWDTYMSESPTGFNEFHVYVCAALLCHFSKQLLQMDFSDMIMFLQDLPTNHFNSKDLELLLAQAYLWHSLFHNAPNHLS